MLKKFTTSPELLHVLTRLMEVPALAEFRLVGGTALSLLRGHRKSDDIDLFTHKEYGSVSFYPIEQELRKQFEKVINSDESFPELRELDNNYGLHLFIEVNSHLIKTDILNWGDEFLFPFVVEENIRLATVEEIATMKLDAISRGGRKKDFWDLSEILETHTLRELMLSYSRKYEYYSIQDVVKGLTDFSIADNMPDPICFKGKHWEVIREEIIKEAAEISLEGLAGT